MVRQANYNDKHDLEKIFVKASIGGFGIAPYKSERAVKLLFNYFMNNLSNTVYATVFEIENTIVATAMLSIKEINNKYFIGVLHSVYTESSYRRQGFASQVIKSLLDIAENLNYKLTYIELNATSNIAVSLYEKCGFVIFDHQNKYMRYYF